jgi:hypothetical protein
MSNRTVIMCPGLILLDSIKISISTLARPVTLSACLAGSRSDEFLSNLGSVAIYSNYKGKSPSVM